MRRGWVGVIVVVACGLGALGWSFAPAVLEPLKVPHSSLEAPAATGSVTVIPLLTGALESSAAVAYRGGRFGEARDFSVGGLLVRHPRGTVLVDAGFSAALVDHIKGLPRMMQLATTARLDEPMGTALARLGPPGEAVDAVILTHAHWDHVSGLADLPGITVKLTRAEAQFVASGGMKTELARSLAGDRLEPLAFEDGPYRGFEASHDYWGDGSLVLVPAGGHTPGSLLAFLALGDGRRAVLIGDLAWQREGVERPAERPWMMRAMVDDDPAVVRRVLRHLHALAAADPGLLVVPAHDARAWAALAP